MPDGENNTKPRPRLAFIPGANPGAYYRQKLEAQEECDVIIRFDLENKCLITERKPR